MHKYYTLVVVAIVGIVCFGEKPARAKDQKDRKGEEQSKEKPKDDGSFICPEKKPELKNFPRADVYKNSPYKAGEIAEYEVRYGGALVGTANLEVRSPYLYQLADKKSYWHRSFHVDAKTGDWYKYIFVAHDKVNAYVRPWDHGISHFFLDQDEGKLFGRRLKQTKRLEFSHEDCKVFEKTNKVGRAEKRTTNDLSYGAMDTLGVGFWLRETQFKVGTKVRGLVYSSEKNWWLEADPQAIEKVASKAGEFEAVKVKLQTYIGQDLQQKGEVYVWIATAAERPIIKIQAEIKLGSVYIELVKFTPGRG